MKQVKIGGSSSVLLFVDLEARSSLATLGTEFKVKFLVNLAWKVMGYMRELEK